MGLMLYGIIKSSDVWMKRCALVLFVFFVLSLGEGLRVPGLADPIAPLPFALWRKAPFIGIMRNPIYFWMMVQTGIAVLAGYGARALSERMREIGFFRAPYRHQAATALLIVILLAEVCQAPLPVSAYRVHPAYSMIERDAAGSVLDAPLGYTINSYRVHDGETLYLQTRHRRPVISGYTQFDSRKRLAFLEQNPVLQTFMDRPVSPTDRAPDPEALQAFLNEHQVRWVLLRKGLRTDQCDRRRTSGWSLQKLGLFLAPARWNKGLREAWSSEPYCGGWDSARAKAADELMRRVAGPPVWDDGELTAYRALPAQTGGKGAP
jgi:hypothetical protein